MGFEITSKVTDLISELLLDGYEGTIRVGTTKFNWTRDILGNSKVIIISGFCKEALHIAEDMDTNEIVMVGRYNKEFRGRDATAKDVAKIAKRFFEYYEARGYDYPNEFHSLFEMYRL